MNYQVFSYMPTSSSGTTLPSSTTNADLPPRPIRVTPSALSPLLYAILYSIEFQSPVGPRPAALRDHSAGRVSSAGAGGAGAGAGGAAGSVGPSAAALLTSAVSVMSSFWGRGAPAAAPAVQPPSSSHPQQQPAQQQQRSATRFASVVGAAIANGPSSASSPPRALTLAEEAELAALQRQHEQPFVIPVTQVLHKLGGVHITVRETHNPTIATAYARAMEEVDGIVLEQEQRLARLSLRSTSFPSQPGARTSASPSTATLINSSGMKGDGGVSAEEHTTPGADRRSPATGAGAARGTEGNASQQLVPPLIDLKRLAISPGTPTSPSQVLGRAAVAGFGSPTYDAAAAPALFHLAESRVGHVVDVSGDELTPGRDEVGLMLSVRLLSKEVTRWRIAHERPLAEWRFPLIRTSSERMMIRPRALSPGVASATTPLGSAPGLAAMRKAEDGGPGGDGVFFGQEYLMANDAAQIHQVLEFILKSSYQTTSMETFTDFTSGELVFDAHVQERRHFV